MMYTRFSSVLELNHHHALQRLEASKKTRISVTSIFPGKMTKPSLGQLTHCQHSKRIEHLQPLSSQLRIKTHPLLMERSSHSQASNTFQLRVRVYLRVHFPEENVVDRLRVLDFQKSLTDFRDRRHPDHAEQSGDELGAGGRRSTSRQHVPWLLNSDQRTCLGAAATTSTTCVPH